MTGLVFVNSSVTEAINIIDWIKGVSNQISKD